MNIPAEKFATDLPQVGGTEIIRLAESARDALSDDIVARLASTLGETMDLLDKINRSGVANALPVLSVMVTNGDLERMAQLARLVGSAQDALSDDIVSRVAATVSDGGDLIDRINRSGVANALPAVARMVENGDLDRLADLARLVGSAQDALSDDIVARLAMMVSDSLELLEKANRCGLGRLLELLQQQNLAHNFLACLDKAAAEAQAAGPSRGGIAGLWDIFKQPEAQDALRFFVGFGKHFRNCQVAEKSG